MLCTQYYRIILIENRKITVFYVEQLKGSGIQFYMLQNNTTPLLLYITKTLYN